MPRRKPKGLSDVEMLKYEYKHYVEFVNLILKSIDNFVNGAKETLEETNEMKIEHGSKINLYLDAILLTIRTASNPDYPDLGCPGYEKSIEERIDKLKKELNDHLGPLTKLVVPR